MNFYLRDAEADDCRTVWELRNEVSARAASLNVEAIPFADHERWYARALDDPSLTILIGEVDEIPIGYVRFRHLDGASEISVVVEPSRRGQGLGSRLIHAGCRLIQVRRGRIDVVALVREGNSASISAFSRAGFVDIGVEAPGWRRMTRRGDAD